ncbi:sorting nexin-10A [Cyprinodon tularosa]|uniref:sorting nexin-10A-like n=1 Tax=Cyprinodon variegatus TaxID=28743 RepID=UPI000742602C|nr:PREDICTED: sorting nexin-10A-like [Cyprinodon variegatus]XP_015229646.1 PREDICTED: sorting nexin-10A-like [Cyprinodon variegatus]XP_038156165.1 sorting nexin-10A [Cyprinodon tularosa]
MDSFLDNLSKSEFVSICVQEPRLHKDDLWHTYVDYEICLHTNSMCFRKKASCVRRRYSDFVWLRNCLQRNALIIELPKLPPWNPFFSLKNKEQVSKRMNGLQEFLEKVLQNPLLLSDSRLHLFLQSDLSITKIERCALGKTRYTVAEAIQQSRGGFYSGSDDKNSCDSDCESSASSGLGLSIDSKAQESPVLFHHSSERDP